MRLHWQGLPCGAPQFLGRTIRPLANLYIPNNATIPDICAIMHKAMTDQGIGGRLGAPYLTHESLIECGAPSRPPQFHLTSMLLAMLTDDCESSTELAVLARSTLRIRRGSSSPGSSVRSNCSPHFCPLAPHTPTGCLLSPRL